MQDKTRKKSGGGGGEEEQRLEAKTLSTAKNAGWQK